MSIDLQQESLLSLRDAAKALPRIDGKRPHVSTLWRWCRRGVRGVRLEYVRLGHRVCTSRGALCRFSQRLAEADVQPNVASTHPTTSRRRTDEQRQRDIERAEQRTKEAGI